MARFDIRSELPGIVWQICVEPGQAVGEGDELIVLESMKMEIPICAPRAATVVSVEIGEGEEVAEGDLVAVLAAD